jgi:hypothetical protein
MLLVMLQGILRQGKRTKVSNISFFFVINQAIQLNLLHAVVSIIRTERIERGVCGIFKALFQHLIGKIKKRHDRIGRV